MTALKDVPLAQPEVLIEEARRRQRRRQVGSAVVALVAIVAAGVFALWSGGGAPGAPGLSGAGGAGAGQTAASWQQLTAAGGYIAPGAWVTTIVDYRGELVAAGTICFRGVAPISGCTASRDPVVWVSQIGEHWRVAFSAKAVGDFSGDEQLVVSHGALLLSSTTGEAGQAVGAPPSRRTVLWRSTNLRLWRRLRVPRAWQRSTVQLASTGPWLLATNGRSVWSSSTGGLTWGRVAAPPQRHRTSMVLGAFGSAFLTVSDSSSGAERLWRSVDGGASWSGSELPLRLVTPTLTTARGLILGVSMPACRQCALIEYPRWSIVWSQPRSGVWHRATLLGAAPTAQSGPYLFSTRAGLLAVDSFPDLQADSPVYSPLATSIAYAADPSQRAIFWSGDGKHWYQLKLQRGLAPGDEVDTAVSAGGALIAAVQATRTGDGLPLHATSFWRLNVSRR